MSKDELDHAIRDSLDAKDTPDEDDIVAAAKALEKSVLAKVAEHEPGPWPESAYTWIVPYFKHFCYPDPLGPKTVADDLGMIRTSLKSGQVTAVQGLTPMIEDWEGKARDSFYDNFLVPFPDAVTNQIEVVDELRLSMWAYENILRSGRVDAKKLLEETKKVVDSFDGDKAAKTQFALVIVGSIAGVMKDWGAGAYKLGLSLVNGSATAGKGAHSYSQSISGKTVAEIFGSFISAAEELRPLMDEQEQKLAEALSDSNETVDGYLNSSDPKTLMTLLPNEAANDGPDITDGKPGDTGEFRPPYE